MGVRDRANRRMFLNYSSVVVHFCGFVFLSRGLGEENACGCGSISTSFMAPAVKSTGEKSFIYLPFFLPTTSRYINVSTILLLLYLVMRPFLVIV